MIITVQLYCITISTVLYIIPKNILLVKNKQKIFVIEAVKQQHPCNGPLSGTTLVSRYQKGKINLDLLKQEIVSGSGIIWAICKSAPRPDR